MYEYCPNCETEADFAMSRVNALQCRACGAEYELESSVTLGDRLDTNEETPATDEETPANDYDEHEGDYWDRCAWTCPICLRDYNPESDMDPPGLSLYVNKDSDIPYESFNNPFHYERWRAARATEKTVACGDCDTVFDVALIPVDTDDEDRERTQ